MTPQEYCKQKVQKSGSSFYYSFLFLPEDQKQAMVALYALCRELDDTVDEIPDMEVARKKLNWWADELAKLFQHQPSHPITQALLPCLEQYQWPRRYFQDLLHGMYSDLQFQTIENFDALYQYCYQVAGVVGLFSTHVFGFSDEDSLQFAHFLGISLQLINIIRDFGEDLKRGRIYIPSTLLEEHQLSPESLYKGQFNDEQLTPIFKNLAHKSRLFYKKAYETLPQCDRYQQKPGLVMAGIYHELLNVIEASDYNVVHQKIKLTPIKKLWVALKVARQENKYHKSLSYA